MTDDTRAEALRIAEIYRVCAARKRELIEWLTDNDMHGLECAATVELERLHYESNTGEHAELLARALIDAHEESVGDGEAYRRIKAERDEARRELAEERELANQYRAKIDQTWQSFERRVSELKLALSEADGVIGRKIRRIEAVEAERDEAIKERDAATNRCVIEMRERDEARAEVEAMSEVVDVATYHVLGWQPVPPLPTCDAARLVEAVRAYRASKEIP